MSYIDFVFSTVSIFLDLGYSAVLGISMGTCFGLFIGISYLGLVGDFFKFSANSSTFEDFIIFFNGDTASLIDLLCIMGYL